MIGNVATYFRRHHVALLALFVALGGTSMAATNKLLPRNSVGTKQLRNSAVTWPKIKNNAVNGAKVADDSLTGTDVLESSLGPVPSAVHATSSDQLGGVAASGYQRRVTGSCPKAAIESIGAGGEVACIASVTAIDALPSAGTNDFRNLGHGLQLATICHDGATVELEFDNVGSDDGTLNWLYGDGSSFSANGAALDPNNGHLFPFAGARIEGQFIFRTTAGVTTVNLHAFDAGSACQAFGTVEFAG